MSKVCSAQKDEDEGGRGKSGDKERRRQRCAISSDRATQDMAAISREWPDLSVREIFFPRRLCTSTTTPCIVNSKCIQYTQSLLNTESSYIAGTLQTTTTLEKYQSTILEAVVHFSSRD